MSLKINNTRNIVTKLGTIEIFIHNDHCMIFRTPKELGFLTVNGVKIRSYCSLEFNYQIKEVWNKETESNDPITDWHHGSLSFERVDNGKYISDVARDKILDTFRIVCKELAKESGALFKQLERQAKENEIQSSVNTIARLHKEIEKAKQEIELETKLHAKLREELASM